MNCRSEKALVLKFGGSSATDMRGANPEYLDPFFESVQESLTKHYARLALIIGGGQRIRALQAQVEGDENKDRVAIAALREHATQLGEIARSRGLSVSPQIPRNEQDARAILHQDDAFAVALGGLKTGQSTDTVAVTAAEIFCDQGYEATVVILSNVWRIFTADPKLDARARPIRRANLHNLIREGVLLNNPAQFRPGMSVTIDPVAVSKLEQRNGNGFIPVWFGHGSDLDNVHRVITQQVGSNGTSIVEPEIATEYYEDEA